MIEKEFGINPYTHEEIVHSFVGQVTSVKETCMENLHTVEDATDIKYKEVKEKYLAYEAKIEMLERMHKQEAELLKENLDKVFK